MKTAGHGRPTKLTSAVQEAICTAVRETGCSDSAAAAVSGIAPSTLTNWKQQAEEGKEPYTSFLNALAGARAEAEYELIRRCHELGKESKDWRQPWSVLENVYKQHYGRAVRQEVTGVEGEPFKVYVAWSPQDDV